VHNEDRPASLWKVRDEIVKRILTEKELAPLRCPICGGAFCLDAGQAGSLRCVKGHSYDPAASGYINFLTAPVSAMYSKALFTARRRVCDAGFFAPLAEKLSTLILDHCAHAEPDIFAIDTGTGEGSLFSDIRARLRTAGLTHTGCGLDLSKQGVLMAAKSDPANLWIVGDIARLPIAGSTATILLNTLSPANYAEFLRILAPGGLIIKTIPGEAHLKELRTLTGQSDYSNAQVIALFEKNLKVLGREHIAAVFSPAPELMADFAAMTPLTHFGGASGSIPDLKTLTLDLHILIGTRPALGFDRDTPTSRYHQ
jgi:23S rRNA (guanine745-N1)-methyltransferase